MCTCICVSRTCVYIRIQYRHTYLYMYMNIYAHTSYMSNGLPCLLHTILLDFQEIRETMNGHALYLKRSSRPYTRTHSSPGSRFDIPASHHPELDTGMHATYNVDLFGCLVSPSGVRWASRCLLESSVVILTWRMVIHAVQGDSIAVICIQQPDIGITGLAKDPAKNRIPSVNYTLRVQLFNLIIYPIHGGTHLLKPHDHPESRKFLERTGNTPTKRSDCKGNRAGIKQYIIFSQESSGLW